jgi:ABC-type nitrate/sulfonate/bicarbonate transport system ATPase subunit
MFDRYLSIEDVSVVFPSRKGPACVLERISLKVKQGEFVAIIGHSGCGKSTLLNVVAGLVPARSGGVVLENKEVNTPGPDRAMVFQSHSLTRAATAKIIPCSMAAIRCGWEQTAFSTARISTPSGWRNT